MAEVICSGYPEQLCLLKPDGVWPSWNLPKEFPDLPRLEEYRRKRDAFLDNCNWQDKSMGLVVFSSKEKLAVDLYNIKANETITNNIEKLMAEQ